MGNSLSHKLVEERAFQPPPPSYDWNCIYDLRRIPSKSPDPERFVPIMIFEPNSRCYNYTIIFSHSNASDIGQSADYLAHFANELGVRIISYDYFGYGVNRSKEGKISSEKACYEDIAAVYEFSLNHFGLRPHQIIFWGRSIGGGPSIHAATCISLGRPIEEIFSTGENWMNKAMQCMKSKEQDGTPLPRVGGVILSSCFTSAIAVVSEKLAKAPLGLDIFINIDKIPFINGPTLVIHGKKDQIVPYEHGVQLFERSSYPWSMLSLENANHNNTDLLYALDIISKMKNFLRFLHINE